MIRLAGNGAQLFMRKYGMYKNEDMLEELVYETLVCLKINKLEGKWLYTVFCNKIKFLQGSSIFLKKRLP